MSDFVTEVRFGILGCANIAKKNAIAILRASNLSFNSNIKISIGAIASRDKSKAEDFCKEVGIDLNDTKICSYHELVQNPNIDVVYIPLPTQLHVEWVTKCAKGNGKHVLLEKPVGTTFKNTCQMIKICKEYNVILMDGTMFMHHKRLAVLGKQISDPIYNHVANRPIHVRSLFSFNAPTSFFESNIRVNGQDPLGALGDLGHYSIRFWLYCTKQLHSNPNTGEFKPEPFVIERAYCDWWLGETPIHVTARVKCGNSTLEFTSSFILPFQQTVELLLPSCNPRYGDSIFKLDDFVIPKNSDKVSHKIINYPTSGPLGEYDSKIFAVENEIITTDCSQETEMMKTMANMVADHKRGNDIQKEKNEWSNYIYNNEDVVHKIFNIIEGQDVKRQYEYNKSDI